MGGHIVGDNVTIVTFADDRIVDCVTASREHLGDEAVELGQRLAGRGLDVLVELLPPAWSQVLVEARFKHSTSTSAIERAFKPVKRAR